MMLADLTPPPGFNTWLASATFVVVLGVNLLKGRKLLAGKPSAAEVDQKVAEQYVTKTEFIAHREGVDTALADLRAKLDRDAREIIEKLEEVKSDLNANSERRMTEFHRRLDLISDIAIRAEDRTKRSS